MKLKDSLEKIFSYKPIQTHEFIIPNSPNNINTSEKKDMFSRLISLFLQR